MSDKAVPHNVILENRRVLRISGVKDIDRFSESKIVLNTVMGELVIKGSDLHIVQLDAQTGDFSMTGRVSALFYNSFSSTDNAVRKLFR